MYSADKPTQSNAPLEQLIAFFSHFISTLQAKSSHSEIQSLIKTLHVIKAQDIALLYATPNGSALMIELIGTIRDKLYAQLSSGQVCGVEFFYILLFIPRSFGGDTPIHTPITPIEIDTRFEVFMQLSKENLFAQSNGDTENLLFIELYILSKALMNMHDFEGIIREYIMLVSLIDINLPLSLEHTHFIVETFENLNVNMPLLIHALKAQQDVQVYFTYPPQARRSILNWQLHCFWNVGVYFNHNQWLELYPLWKDMFYTLLERGDVEGIDEAMYMQFFIYHICGNNFHHQEQWREFCADIDRVAARHYEAFAKTQGIYGVKMHQDSQNSQNKGKKTIAFLRDRLVANSPYKVEYSLLSNLMNDNAFKEAYQVKIYTMKLLEKSVDDEGIINSYRQLGIEVVDVVSHLNTKGFYNSHLQKALCIKTALNNDNVEILISPNNGYGISDFILASRSAPLQIYYSHGNFVYDLPCIDYKMTHICQNKLHITHEGYEFLGVPVKMQERFYNPPLSTKEKQEICQIRERFPKDSILLGSIGRLMKLHSIEYWECVIDIMRSFPQSHYLACGGGNSKLICDVIYKVCPKEAEIFLERVHFMGYVDSKIYGHIIDIWLDSFPLEQGESRIEYAAKGGLNLVMSKQDKQSRFDTLCALIEEWRLIPHKDGSPKTQEECQSLLSLTHEEYMPFVAFSKQEYKDKAKALLQAYASNDKACIDKWRGIIKTLLALNDELRISKGVSAFKAIMGLPPK